MDRTTEQLLINKAIILPPFYIILYHPSTHFFLFLIIRIVLLHIYLFFISYIIFYCTFYSIADQSRFIECAFLGCSPDSASFKRNGTTFICQDFADKLYSSCKSSDGNDPDTGACVKVSSIGSNGKEVLEKYGIYTVIDGTEGCFNEGESMMANKSWTVVVAVAGMLFFGRM